MARPKKKPAKLKEWPTIRPCYRPDGITIKSWMVDSGVPIGDPGKRIQKRHLTEEAAKAHAERIRTLYSNAGHSGFKISDREREDAKDAMSKLAKAGLQSTLSEVADFFIRHRKPHAGNLTLSKLCEKYIENRRAQEVRERTILDYTKRLKQFTNAIGGQKDVKDITRQDLESYLNRADISQQNKRNDYTVLASLFEYGMRPDDYQGKKTSRTAPLSGWLAVSPLQGLFKPVKPKKVPSIFHADDARALLKVAYETRHTHEKGDYGKLGLLAKLVLELFAGIRPEAETPHIQWRDIEISGETGTLNIIQSKITAGTRNINLLPIAVEWLRLCPDQEGPICHPENYRRRWEQWKKLIAIEKWGQGTEKKFKWPQDVCRHSFASVHYRIGQDDAKTRAYLGQGTKESATFFAHYRALMSEKQAQAIMDLRPAAVLSRPDNILSIVTGTKVTKSPKQSHPKRKVAAR
jgi:integrase